jgi:hypothetical protein
VLSIPAGVRRGWRRVIEGIDLLAHGGVFVGDVPVGDAGVDEDRLEGPVTEERGGRFDAHAAVACRGGQGVAQAVRVHVRDSGVGADAGPRCGAGSPVQGRVVVGEEPP